MKSPDTKTGCPFLSTGGRCLGILSLIFLSYLHLPAQSDPSEENREVLRQFQDLLPYSLAYGEIILKNTPLEPIIIDPQKNWKENLKVIQDNLRLNYRIIGGQLILFPKKNYLIQGKIYDANTGESLPGAHILLTGHLSGTTSNEDGYFQLLVPEGQLNLSISYLGYQTVYFDREVEQPLRQDFRLKGVVELPAVIITENSPGIPGANAYGEEGDKIPVSLLSVLPGIGSSMDVGRYLQLTGGVITGGDGLGGIHVRGGNADQNLILLEDIPIYNAFHLFGVSSIFNSNAIQAANLSKTYFEPSLDGRLSSVLRVNIRDGHRTQPRLEASVGLLGTQLMVETPFANQRGTLMLAGQQSHAGSLIKSYTGRKRSLDDKDGYLQPSFRDIYLKAMINLDARNKIILNGYTGSDTHLDINQYLFQDISDTLYSDAYQDEYYWGNTAIGLKWLHEIHGKAFLKMNLYHSRYSYQSINASRENLEFNQQTTESFFEINEFRSSIRESGFKTDLDFLINYRHRIKTGISYARHDYRPGIIAYGEDALQVPEFSIGSPLPGLPDSLFDDLTFKSSQWFFHLEDLWDPHPAWKINYGINAILFSNASDHFTSIQPRINISRTTEKSHFALSINKLYQPQHLISADDNGLPNALWVPASLRFRPQKSWQTNFSWSRKLADRGTLTSSIYYKQMAGLVTFRDAPAYLSFGPLDNVDASIWEEDVLSGEGRAWGIENQVNWHWQNFLVQFNYTFARSNRYFEGKHLDFIVPYEFESPHTFNLLGVWEINQRWKLTATWQLSSGTRNNLIPGSYEIYDNAEFFLEEFTIPENTVELLIMPVYHRLDLSVTYLLKKNHHSHQFKLGLLNLYDRRNIVFPRLYRDEITEIRYIEGLPFVPTLSYQLTIN